MALRQLASAAAQRTRLCWGDAIASSTCSWAIRAALSRGFSSVAEGYKYTKSHEWAKVEGDVATIGISQFASEQLGDVVYVELPESGTEVTKGETFGVVESVKAASDVYSPLSGEVVGTNQDLVESPDLVNSDAFGEGWMLKVKLTDPSELDGMMDAAAYTKIVEESSH